MKHKSTKSALLMSIVSILVCFAMLVGSTFAWFTDTATVNVNKIQSGSLDVDIVDENGASLTGKTLKFKKADGHTEEAVLWEPGCTYELEGFKIVNNGNLALKFSIELSGITGNAKLNEAIEWTAKIGSEAMALTGANGNLLPEASSDLIVITGHMDEEAGDEYQGLSIDGISVTVFATQLASEYDSFTNQYDIDTAWTGATGVVPAANEEDGKIHITNGEQLAALAAAVNAGNTYSGQTIVLDKDIDLNNVNWTPIGYSTGVSFEGTFDGANHTILNLKANGTREVGLFGLLLGEVKDVKFDKANVTGINHVAVVAGTAYGSVSGCEVKNAVITSNVFDNDDGDKAGTIVGYLTNQSSAGTVKNCKVENVTVTGYRDIGGIVGYAEDDATVTGNDIKNSTIINDQTVNYKTYTTDAAFDVHEIIGEDGLTGRTGNTQTNVTINYIKAPSAAEATAAISAAKKGDTVVLTGKVELPATIADGVTLKGDGNTVIDCPESTLSINSEGTTFENLTLDLGKEQTFGSTDGAVRISKDVVFSDVTFKYSENAPKYAITVSGESDVTFINCKFDLEGKTRGIMVWGGNPTITVDGCYFDCVYPFNVDGGTPNFVVKNSTLNGWTSYTYTATASFENCKFGMSTSEYAYCRPYSDTTFTNCEFSSDFLVDFGAAGLTFTMNGCTKNGAAVTAATICDSDLSNSGILIIDGTSVPVLKAN